ncbi:MAG: lysophospholipid acyltransferase family protein [bacterium]
MFGPSLLSAYIKTLRIKIHNKNAHDQKAVYIFWHSKMILGWWLFRDRKFAALVSQSKDGEILTRLLDKWNYNTIRGSSSKGGKEALAELNSAIQNTNTSAVITPDGPRGPALQIKNGALIIAKENKIPIIPLKITYYKKKMLIKSWDKFELPLPFSKCEVNFGDKHYYDEFLEEDKLEEFKQRLSDQM